MVLPTLLFMVVLTLSLASGYYGTAYVQWLRQIERRNDANWRRHEWQAALDSIDDIMRRS